MDSTSLAYVVPLLEVPEPTERIANLGKSSRGFRDVEVDAFYYLH